MPDISKAYSGLETELQALQGIRALLRHVGEDPDREGLRDTPARVLRALQEMNSGHSVDVKKLLEVSFDSGDYDEVIVVRNISFTSSCEHHLLPFSGVAHVAYLPAPITGKVEGLVDGQRVLLATSQKYRVVGLSKIPRVVDAFARRLQLQEQMTTQIARALMEHLQPRGVAVVCVAEHSCMSCRGVRKAGADMVTSSMLGKFREDIGLRTEVLRLIGNV
jgi:GTP cyclohydrolase I